MKLRMLALLLLSAFLLACNGIGPEPAKTVTIFNSEFGISFQVEKDALINRQDTASSPSIRVVCMRPNGHFTFDLGMFDSPNTAYLDSTMEWFMGRHYPWMVDTPAVDTVLIAAAGPTLHNSYRSEIPVEEGEVKIVSKLYNETFWIKYGNRRFQLIFSTGPQTEADGRKALAAVLKSIKIE